MLPRIVYLDQCAVSRFVDRPVDASWKVVHDLLRRGVNAGRVVCPHSLEHAVETSGMVYESAVEMDSTLRQLSAGWSLRPEPELVAGQINQSVRQAELDPDYAFQPTQLRPLSDVGAYEALRRVKAGLDARNRDQFAFLNGLNAELRDGSRAPKSVLRLFAQWKNEGYARRFIADLEPALRDGRPHVVTRPGVPDHLSEFSVITALLIEIHRFGVPELQSLATEVRKRGVIFLPFFLAKVNLEACHLWKQKRRDHGDQYDITRLSCALPVADLIVTDRSAASAIRDMGLDQEFGVQVFSTGDAERDQLVEALKAPVV
jgi:hypothetical protein